MTRYFAIPLTEECVRPVGSLGPFYCLTPMQMVGFAGLGVVAGISVGQDVRPSERTMAGLILASNALLYVGDIIEPTLLSRNTASAALAVTSLAGIIFHTLF